MEPNYIFVFGSNPEGRHGAGAAKHALKFGAKYGIGRGLQGQTYALPTKNLKEGFIEKLPDGSTITYDKAGCKSLSKETIVNNIKELYDVALSRPDLKFFIPYKREDKNLNGYTSQEMFDMFSSLDVLDNVYFHNSWKN